MQYIVLEVRRLEDGTLKTVLSSYLERNKAENKYYNTLAQAAISTFPVHSVILVTDTGKVLKSDKYEHEVTPNEG